MVMYEAPKIEIMRDLGGEFMSFEESTMRNRKSLIEKWKEHYKTPIMDTPRNNLMEIGCVIYFMTTIFSIIYVFVKTYEGEHYYATLLLTFYLFIQTFSSWVRVRKEAKRNICDETISRNKISVSYATEGHRDPDTPNPLMWKYCNICKLDVPPRSHHCKVCQLCILKRGHHCYLTDVCIGYHNQRHFMKMCLFSFFYGALGLWTGYSYLSQTDDGEWYDYILPVGLVRCLFGLVELKRILAIFTTVYTLWWSTVLSVGLLSSHIIAMMEGRTQHESKFDSPVVTKSRRGQRLTAVLGEKWLLGFIIPGNRGWSTLRGDGVVWSDLALFYDVAKPPPVYSNVRPEGMSMQHI